MEPAVSKATVMRCLNRMYYKFLQAKRKGRLSDRDRSETFKFARKMKSNFKDSMWTKDISIYLEL